MIQTFDLVIIGGGFYGVSIALHLKKYFSRIAIIEAEADLFTRASYNNQARIHNGYHYPRSPITALRSHVNFQRFLSDYAAAIDGTFQKLYVIAKQNSKITSLQFYNFMKNIGAPIQEGTDADRAYFAEEMIDAVFRVQEVAFNAGVLRDILKQKLAEAGVSVLYNQQVMQIKEKTDYLEIELKSGLKVIGKTVFNCTYADINTLLRRMDLPLLPLKYELTEMTLVTVPKQLQHLGITVMDGPFFSLMPFPHRGLHSLSHVRYTPHQTLNERQVESAYRALLKNRPNSRFLYMQKDGQKYLPSLRQCVYQDSLFEIKTVLQANEADDGRPILFRKDYGGMKNFYVVMGGKIDNIYDIFEKIDQEFLNNI